MAAHGAGGRRVLVIGADGLRPDLLDTGLMPAVGSLIASGVRCVDHHAVFPSHTRVIASTLATGTTPGRHGIVANTMLVPHATEDHIIDTSNYRHLDALDAYSSGNAQLAPSLADILAERGERVAVAATSTGGASLLWARNHRGRIVNVNTAYGIADLYDLREKLGEIPPVGWPQIARAEYATRAVTDLLLHDPANRVIVLWLNEPDASLHKYGLGAPETREAMRGVDHCLAAILTEMDAQGVRDDVAIFFVSDHGHSTVESHSTLRDYLAIARRELGAASLPPLTTASDYIYATPGTPEPSAEELAPLVEWLVHQEWCDIVFAGREDLELLPGVLSLRQVWNGASNERRPLLAVSPVWSDEPNEHGVPGAVATLTAQSALRSSHGSASPFDMHATLVASGPSFREGTVSTLPTGATDIMPTILTLLGLTVPTAIDGRVLWEALRDARGEPGNAGAETLEPLVPLRGATPRVRLQRVGATTYVDGSVGRRSGAQTL
ncbi:MAG TPA: alkaline phosphatase family protein [Thermomicrobiales bacterium]|nr:alkaline phosphatase family protein [Thermomicrobiales bacterium]